MSESGINRSLSRAWTAPVRAMNRFLGTPTARRGRPATATRAARWWTAGCTWTASASPVSSPRTRRCGRPASGTTPSSGWACTSRPQDEMSGIAHTYGLHELAVEDAVKAEQRPKLEQFGAVHFLVLRTARYVPHSELTETSQVVETGQMMIFIGRAVRHHRPARRRVRAGPGARQPGEPSGPPCSSRARGRWPTRSPTGWSTSTSRSPTRWRPTWTSSRRARSPGTPPAGCSRSTR